VACLDPTWAVQPGAVQVYETRILCKSSANACMSCVFQAFMSLAMNPQRAPARLIDQPRALLAAVLGPLVRRWNGCPDATDTGLQRVRLRQPLHSGIIGATVCQPQVWPRLRGFDSAALFSGGVSQWLILAGGQRRRVGGRSQEKLRSRSQRLGRGAASLQSVTEAPCSKPFTSYGTLRWAISVGDSHIQATSAG
jgi:hypothetical protein